MNALNSAAPVGALRTRLWDAGFRPVPLLTGEKHTLVKDWTGLARRNPPAGAVAPARADYLNTGILCDGLRAVDIDVDDPATADRVRTLATAMLGMAPTRTRRNSPRAMLLYRAAEGAPGKLSVSGTAGKIEVLGRGQQLHGFGRHPSGETPEWQPAAPGELRRDDLPAVSEARIAAFLAAVSALIGAAPPPEAKSAEPESLPRASLLGQEADPLRIATALNSIPNTGPADWEHWNRVGMAVWAATAGSDMGFVAFDAWSARHDAYDPEATAGRWAHYRRSPPTEIGAGALFHLAKVNTRTAAEAPPAAFHRDDDDPFGGRNWLVYQALVERGVAFMAGQSGAGKTFAALDLALSVATGTPFGGNEVDRQGGVLYIAGEGAAEIPLRWRAAKAARGFEGQRLPFLWRDRPPCYLLERGASEHYTALARDAAAELATDGVPLVLTVVDTLTTVAGWQDENSSAEAQRALNVLQDMARESGALVLAIDHYGKDATAGVRGSSAKYANADNVVAVLCDRDPESGAISNRRLSVQKCRGAREGHVIPFDLSIVSAGVDNRGRPETTCTLNWDVCRAAQGAAKLPRTAAAALDVLKEMIRTDGKTLPDGRVVVPEEQWRQECDDRRVSTSDNAKNRADVMRRAFAQLLDRKRVAAGGGNVWLPDMGEFPPLDDAIAATVAAIAPATVAASRGPDARGVAPAAGVSARRAIGATGSDSGAIVATIAAANRAGESDDSDSPPRGIAVARRDRRETEKREAPTRATRSPEYDPELEALP